MARILLTFGNICFIICTRLIGNDKDKIYYNKLVIDTILENINFMKDRKCNYKILSDEIYLIDVEQEDIDEREESELEKERRKST